MAFLAVLALSCVPFAQGLHCARQQPLLTSPFRWQLIRLMIILNRISPSLNQLCRSKSFFFQLLKSRFSLECFQNKPAGVHLIIAIDDATPASHQLLRIKKLLYRLQRRQNSAINGGKSSTIMDVNLKKSFIPWQIRANEESQPFTLLSIGACEQILSYFWAVACAHKFKTENDLLDPKRSKDGLLYRKRAKRDLYRKLKLGKNSLLWLQNYRGILTKVGASSHTLLEVLVDI